LLDRQTVLLIFFIIKLSQQIFEKSLLFGNKTNITDMLTGRI